MERKGSIFPLINTGCWLGDKLSVKNSKLDLFLKQTARLVDPVIKEILTKYLSKENQKLIKYQISIGGKRIRPALAIFSSRLLRGKMKDVLYPAAGLEILHNYTLIVDDIIDNSLLRRNKPTVWFNFGRSIAQCLGMDYSAALFQAASYSKKAVEISELFAKTLKEIVDGEILDILFEEKGRPEEPYIEKNRYQKVTKKDYFKMVSKKTASLFQASCQVGGICAKASKKELRALKNYGFNLGMAFQISDDILDIFGKEELFGKEIGKDIKERKRGNIVILFALEELSSKERKNLLKIIKKKKIKNRDVEKAVGLIEKTKAQEKAYQLGKSFIEKAKKNLNLLPQNKWNSVLRELADFIMERKK
jgi:geranylgeranyl diphosphate synthase type I